MSEHDPVLAALDGQAPVYRYRKKPVVIEAWQYHRANDEAPEWVDDAFGNGLLANVLGKDGVVRLHVRTLEDGPSGEAKHVADPGDWIIRGVAGEFYPCKPDIFEATYEPAGAAPVKAALEYIGRTSRGYTIYREPNGVGGHRYWSDEIGSGVVVWDTVLVSSESLKYALTAEATARRGPDSNWPLRSANATEDVAGLIERLSDKWKHSEEDCYAAAAALSRLSAEVEQLRGFEVDTFNSWSAVPEDAA